MSESGIWTPGPDTSTGNPDTFDGSEGNDVADGQGSSDTLYGNGGNDTLLGGEGEDELQGGSGDDYLDGGPGQDNLIGGEGSDTYHWVPGEGTDTFTGDETDYVYLDGNVTFETGEPNGEGFTPVNVTVEGGGTGQVWVSGLNPDNIIVVCFAEGTRVVTDNGEVCVEGLRAGDQVLTAGQPGGLRPVAWVGHSRVQPARHANPQAVAPILIRAGALGDGVPHRDMRVSPEHGIFLDGHLVPARLLVNGETILQDLSCPEIVYWHVELESHALLLSEGAWTESYFDDGNRQFFDNHRISALSKDFISERGNGRYARAACAPVMTEGPALQRLRARLLAEADAVRSVRMARAG